MGRTTPLGCPPTPAATLTRLFPTSGLENRRRPLSPRICHRKRTTRAKANTSSVGSLSTVHCPRFILARVNLFNRKPFAEVPPERAFPAAFQINSFSLRSLAFDGTVVTCSPLISVLSQQGSSSRVAGEGNAFWKQPAFLRNGRRQVQITVNWM